MIGLALARFLRGTPWSTLMAIMGVALGVTSIVSVHLISASVAQQLDKLVPGSLAQFSHFLHRDALTAQDYFELRRRWRAGEVGEIESMSPIIDESVLLDAQTVRVIGIDLFSAGADLRESDITNTGETNTTTQWSWQGVWVDATLADVVQRPVNGVLDIPAGTLITDIGVAQDILGWSPERLSYVGISAPDPWAWLKALGENLLPGFAAGLPQLPLHFEDLGQWQVLSLSAQHPVSQFGKSVLFNISALGLLAMLVSWFLMYQVAVSWLRRLWPVFTRLHVLGVEWRTLRGYFVLAMISLGLLAGIVGLFIGKSLAESLFSLTVGDNSTRFALHPWVIGKALMSAVGVCFVGGLWAFRQAQMPVRKPGRSAFVWVGLVVLAGVGVFYPGSGLIGGFMSIALLSVLTAILAGPLLRRIRTYAQYIRGPYLVRLSVREALWYPQDLAVALSGLALAVATAIGVGLMIDSFREDFSRMLERRLSYDLVAQGETHGLQNMLSQVAQSPGVTRIQSYAEGTLRVQGVPLALQIAHMDEVESARYGYNGALSAHQALISEQGARALSVQVGEVFSVGAEAVQIVGIFQSFGDLQPRLIVDRTHALGASGLALDSVSMNSPAPQQLIAGLRRQFPQLDLRLQTEIRQLALDTFDRTFTITTVLIVIAMLVATIGVYIAVTTLRLNKRVSTRLMAGMGVNRWEDAGMDFALGIGIGFLALLLALPLGICFGWILCSVINPRAFGWTVDLQLNPATIFWPLFWGMLAASIAGVVRVGRQESPGHARA